MRLLTKQQIVRCPNCGSKAERNYFTSKETIYHACPDNQVIQTECAVCDYLMVMCSLDGSVVEAQAPGTWIPANSKQVNDISNGLVKDGLKLSLVS